ncbi:hypothetical protein DFH06DRAFT_1186370 [Mycena polygramma]|nr:hypothetical protein DFH06DRAFT_1186370 [Mycena polygramma]
MERVEKTESDRHSVYLALLFYFALPLPVLLPLPFDGITCQLGAKPVGNCALARPYKASTLHLSETLQVRKPLVINGRYAYIRFLCVKRGEDAFYPQEIEPAISLSVRNRFLAFRYLFNATSGQPGRRFASSSICSWLRLYPTAYGWSRSDEYGIGHAESDRIVSKVE